LDIALHLSLPIFLTLTSCLPLSSLPQAWGHSSVVNPWGEVIATTGHEPDMVTAEIDLAQVDDVRKSIPTSYQKREDIYKLVETKK